MSEIIKVNEQNQSISVQSAQRNQKFELQPLVETAGTLEVTDEQLKILWEDIDETKILIRPDGLIYLPWTFYQDRLDRAFKMKWALIPDDNPIYRPESNEILWGFALVIDGKFIDYAYGQSEYIPENRTMTYGDAIEGAKSNALMRCCKRLGIGLKLWDKEYVEYWKSKYAYSVYDPQRKRNVWHKKTKSEIEKEKIVRAKTEKVDIVEAEVVEVKKKKVTEKDLEVLRILAQDEAFEETNDKGFTYRELILKEIGKSMDKERYDKLKERMENVIKEHNEKREKTIEKIKKHPGGFDVVCQVLNWDKLNDPEFIFDKLKSASWKRIKNIAELLQIN